MNFATRLSLVTAGVLSLAICAVVATALRGGLENARARQQAELAAVGLLMRDALDRSSAFALAQAESLARQPRCAARWPNGTGRASPSASARPSPICAARPGSS